MSYMPKSKSDIHETPDEVFEAIRKQWCLNAEKFFDPCPVDPQFDGLKIDWEEANFVNPPYGDGKKDENGRTLLSRFVYKAIDEWLNHDRMSIMLLPSKTDQTWFHVLLDNCFEIYWFDHRLKFKNNKWTSTQPHFLVMIN